MLASTLPEKIELQEDSPSIIRSKTTNLILVSTQVGLTAAILIIGNGNNEYKRRLDSNYYNKNKELSMDDILLYQIVILLTDWMLFLCYSFSTLIVYRTIRLNMHSLPQSKVEPAKIVSFFIVICGVLSIVSQINGFYQYYYYTSIPFIESSIVPNYSISVLIMRAFIKPSKLIITIGFLLIIGMSIISAITSILFIYSILQGHILYNAIIEIGIIFIRSNIIMYSNILLVLTYIFATYNYIQESRSINNKDFSRMTIYHTISALLLTTSISNIDKISTIIGNIGVYCFEFVIGN